METKSGMQFDAVIPYHEKDSEILPYCIEGVRRNLDGLRNIYIVSKDDPDIDGVTWIAETRFPFTMEDVGQIIPYNRRGWYYQQLLKLYVEEVVPELLDHYLILDSDVVFIKPVTFFQGTKLLLDYNGINQEQYDIHMKAVLPDVFENISSESGVTDHMMFRKDIMQELKGRVEEIHGESLWKVFLNKIDPAYYNMSGMSEYNFYFHYVLTLHPELYEMRLLRKCWGEHLYEITQRQDMDFITFHSWYRTASATK